MTDLLIAFSPLLLGLLFILAIKTNLRNYQAVYLLLSAGFVFLLWSLPLGLPLWELVGGVLLGEVAHFALVAAAGAKVKPSTGASILYGLGLFPWFALSTIPNVFYIMLFFVFGIIYSYGKMYYASKKTGVRLSKPASMKRLTPSEDYAAFDKAASTVLAVPFLLSALTVMLFIIL